MKRFICIKGDSSMIINTEELEMVTHNGDTLSFYFVHRTLPWQVQFPERGQAQIAFNSVTQALNITPNQ